METKADKSSLIDASSGSIGPTRLEDTDFARSAHNTSLLDSTMPDLPKLDLSNRWLKMPRSTRNSTTENLDQNASSVASQQYGNTARQVSYSSTDRTGGWTPSPDQSASRSGRRASPRSSLASNESIGSSLGTFDYSNASFSESFLRRAGAHMLAGLTESSSPAASSPTAAQFRSSPTLKGNSDPRTPHISKAWQTRLLEAASLASPGSSEGSSPSSSFGLKTPIPSRLRSAAQYDSPSEKEDPPISQLAAGQRNLGGFSTEPGEGHNNASAATNELSIVREQENSLVTLPAEASILEHPQDDPQGLSIVVEESFEQELSRMVDLEEAKMIEADEPIGAPTQTTSASGMSPPSELDYTEQTTSTLSPSAALRMRPRTSPKVFTRLKQITPVRSPLSKMVSPESTLVSSPTAWESPLSTDRSVHASTNVLPAVLSDKHESVTITSNRGNLQKAALDESPQSAFHSFAASISENTPPRDEVVDRPSFFTPSSTHCSTPAILPHRETAVYETPSWTPSPPSAHQTVEVFARAEAEDDSLHSSASSVCTSSSSAKKQGGDDLHHAHPSLEHDVQSKTNMSCYASPSVVRNTKLQLQRGTRSKSSSFSLKRAVKAIDGTTPELQTVTAVFDKLAILHSTQKDRTLSQLQDATLHNEQLKSRLELASSAESDLRAAQATTADQLSQVQKALSQLTTQYDQLLRETEAKDQSTAQLLTVLHSKVRDGSGKAGHTDFEQLWEEEKKLREIDRRDWEVRLSAIARTPATQTKSLVGEGIWITEQDLTVRMEEVKAQALLTAQKDFDIRHSIEMQSFVDKIADLESQLEEGHHDSKLCRSSNAADQALTAQLDAREEEIRDLRSELDLLVSQKEAVQDRVQQLEEELTERANRDSSDDLVQDLENRLVERDAELQRLQETFLLTQSQLESVTAQTDELRLLEQQLSSQLSHLDSKLCRRDAEVEANQARSTGLEQQIERLTAHVLTLEHQLRSPQGSSQQDTDKAVAETDRGDIQQHRVKQLERQVADLDLQVVKLQKANEALQADNMISSIALSAKQLELGMVKRNARFALKNPSSLSPTKAAEGQTAANDSPVVQRGEPKFPVVPSSAPISDADKENVPMPKISAPVVNKARLHARQMLALRQGQIAQESRQLLAA